MRKWEGVDVENLERASRLEEMGISIRSAELVEQAKTIRERAERARAFVSRGGNRAMRRAAARARRKRG